jgi:hypothetical protein
MATTECTLKVGIAPLRAAILAVVPHADKVRLGDEDLVLSRVRLIAGEEELLVVATNDSGDGQTSAMAAVPIEEDDRLVRFEAWDGPFVVDLHPAKARDIARQIKPVKADEDTDPGPSSTGWADLHLTLDRVQVTDVSGLWPGTKLTVPILAYRPEYPDVPAVIGRALQHADGKFKPLVHAAAVARRFAVAATVYEQQLEWEPTGTPESSGFVVICGPDFAGVAESQHGLGNSLKARDRRRMRHLERAGADLQPALG